MSSRRLGKSFGIESVPIPIVPVPLPVRYRIYYGKPIPVHREYSPDAADDPTILKLVAERVQQAVADLLKQGLSERGGVCK